MSRVEWLRKTMLWRGFARLVKGQWGEAKLPGPRRVRPSLEILEDRLTPAGPILVTSGTDDGTGKPGTLSAAINQANAPGNSGSVIDFNLPGGATPQTITVTGLLPAIGQPTTIMGSSQGGPNAAIKPWIELNGSQINQDGLTVNSGGVVIEGLAVDNFKGNGIVLNNPAGVAGDMLVADNVGSGLDGATAGVGNTGNGIVLTGGRNTIGSSTGLPCVISGNGMSGIDIARTNATGNVVQNDYIGVDLTGLNALPNTVQGVFIEQGATGNTIGGTGQTNQRNVISGNGTSGVSIDSSSGNVIGQNYIGVGKDGLTQVANGGSGVFLPGASNNTIGGSMYNAANVISGNTLFGVLLSGGVDPVTGNLISGNYIGVGVDGTTAVGNGSSGVALGAASQNTIGGTAGNVISRNGGDGIEFNVNSLGNLVTLNRIGTSLDGSVALGNSLNGVLVQGCCNTIGGSGQTFGGNVISGNNSAGVEIDGMTNTLVGNRIGTDASGTKALPNKQGGGVVIYGSGNTIGGTGQNAQNVISGNAGQTH